MLAPDQLLTSRVEAQVLGSRCTRCSRRHNSLATGYGAAQETTRNIIAHGDIPDAEVGSNLPPGNQTGLSFPPAKGSGLTVTTGEFTIARIFG